MKKYTALNSVEMGISIILIIAVMSILVFYFNPSKKITEKRNTQRTEDVTKVLNGLTQFAADNGGVLPDGIPVSNECGRSEYEMCKTNGSDCTNLVELEGFSNNGKYMSALPVDPRNDSANGTGYNIVQNESGRITVCAPKAELGQSISASK